MWTAGNIIIGGLVTGSIYALLAVGYSLVFSVSGALNLAQGAFVAMGALVMYTFMTSAHLPLPLAFLASLAVVCAAVAIIEWVVIRPAVTRVSHANLLMMMGGLLTAFEGAAFLIWGSNPFSFNQFTGSHPVTVGKLSIPTQAFWVVGAMLAAVAVLSWLMSRTRWGRGLRATSENMTAARLMGVPVDRMILISFVAAAVLGVIGGAVIAPLTSLDYTSMATYTNEGLIAVSLGGLGSVYGSVAGGLVLGVIEAVVSGYVSSLFSTTISLLVLIAIIFFRPQGLLGRVRGARMDVADRVIGRFYTPPKLPRRWTWTGAVILAVVMFFLPRFVPPGDMRAVNITGIFCITIVGLDLLTGIAGQVSLGQAGFMAIGGYTSAILAVRFHVPTLLGLLAGAAGSALVAALLGSVCGRLRGMYLAITTLAFGILVEALASGLNITGGPSGIVGIPPLSIGGLTFDNDIKMYDLVLVLLAVALILSANLVRSNRGRILRAMHGDQIGARSLGLHVARAKIAVFVISACFASIAGSLYASYFRYLSPDQVGSATSLQLITMVVIGGMGTLFGPLIGVVLLTYLPLVSQSFANYQLLVTGVLLVLFLRYLPAGIWGGVLEAVARARARWALFRGKPPEAPAVAAAAPTAPAAADGTAAAPVTGAVPATPVTGAGPATPATGGAPAADRAEERAAGRGASPAAAAAAAGGAGGAGGADGAGGPGGAGGPDAVDAAGGGAAMGEPAANGQPRGIARPGAPATASGAVPALELRGLSKSFGGVAAVREVSFEVTEGSLTALIGPNGAGKSTLYNLVTNLYRPDEGNVYLHGRRITGVAPEKVTSLGLFRTFQTARIFPQLTVLENVLIGGYRLGRAGYLAQSLWLPRCRREESDLHRRARSLLEVMGLASRAAASASVLPLASQKYVELARALMAQPSVLILDEPGAGMNDAETAELGMILRAIRDNGHTVLVVEHNMSLVMGVCDRVVVMDAGRIIASGSPEEVQRDPEVIGAYFGAAEASA